MTGRVRVGMSGFSYPEWVGALYPPGTKRGDMLARYAERFAAVEINMTFRRFPQESTLVRWRDTVGEDFRFAVKAHRRITHTKRLVDAADDVADFLRAVRVLGERLGPILYQTPPSLAYDPGVLTGFLSALPPVARHAFEPRHASFESREVHELLASHRIARCLNDELDDAEPHRPTGPLAYLRLRREAYEAEDLSGLARRLRTWAEGGADVYVFFKHEDRPDAVEPALRLQELVS